VNLIKAGLNGLSFFLFFAGIVAGLIVAILLCRYNWDLEGLDSVYIAPPSKMYILICAFGIVLGFIVREAAASMMPDTLADARGGQQSDKKR